jgi:hypothetical protein
MVAACGEAVMLVKTNFARNTVEASAAGTGPSALAPSSGVAKAI